MSSALLSSLCVTYCACNFFKNISSHTDGGINRVESKAVGLVPNACESCVYSIKEGKKIISS